MSKAENKTEEELNQLVRDTMANQIFWASMVPEKSTRLLGNIFMPLLLMEKPSEEDLKTWGDVYEYLDKAGPRSINGYPCFFSFQVVTVHDRAIIGDKVKAAQEAMDRALEK